MVQQFLRELESRVPQFPLQTGAPESESSASSLPEAEILSVDDLGDSKVIHLRQDNLVISMKSSAEFKIPNNKIKYVPNWGKIHWFDAEGGHRLKKG